MTTSSFSWRFYVLAAGILAVAGVAAAEGPVAIFGFETRYETTPAGAGRVRVDALTPAGPAQKAGFKLGDRILKLNGKSLSFANDLDYMRSLSAFNAGVPIQVEVLRGEEHLLLELIPAPATAESRAGLARWMEKLRLCFEEGSCEPCMAPSSAVACAARTDEMRSLEAAEELAALVKVQGGATFILERDAAGKISVSSTELKIPAGYDPHRCAYLAPRLGDLEAGQKMKLRLLIESDGRTLLRILEQPGGSLSKDG